MDAKTTPTRLPPASYTFFRNWLNCPRQAWHVNIARDIAPAESAAMRWGTRVHAALERHLGLGEELPPELAHHAHLYQFPVGYEIDAERVVLHQDDPVAHVGEPQPALSDVNARHCLYHVLN